MEQTQITLLICIAAGVVLISTSIDNYKKRNKDNTKFALLDKFAIFIGIPFLIFAIIAFCIQTF